MTVSRDPCGAAFPDRQTFDLTEDTITSGGHIHTVAQLFLSMKTGSRLRLSPYKGMPAASKAARYRSSEPGAVQVPDSISLTRVTVICGLSAR